MYAREVVPDDTPQEFTMSTFDRAEFALACPACKKDMKVKYGDVYGSRHAKCQRCSAEVQFDSSAASNLRSATQEVERAQDKLQKAVAAVLNKAQVKLK
jgi:hypothetical protein